jgi:hypothetical protein
LARTYSAAEIADLCRRIGRTGKPTVHRNPLRPQILALAEQGVKQVEIARRLGIKRQAVVRAMK